MVFQVNSFLPTLSNCKVKQHFLGYNSYRGMCSSGTYKEVRSFSELNNDGFLSGSDVRKLERHYDHIDDIDLFVAGVLEAPHLDSLVGPAFKCIIGDQFIRFIHEEY